MNDKVELAYLHPSSAEEGWHEDECGNLKYWPEEVAALQSTIAQLEDKLNKAIDLDFQRRETIEQLQARVQELESGRGEPAAWEMDDTAGESGLVQVTNNPSVRDDWVRNELPVCPLFSAPPAPVAVVLPDLYSAAKEYIDLRDKIKKEGTPPHSDYWHQSLHETDVNLRCWLDAAALNGDKK